MWYNFTMIEKRERESQVEIYELYIDRISYQPEYAPKARIGASAAGWQKRVKSTSYRDALLKCLPDIRREFPKLRGKYVSVFVGKPKSPSTRASRLSPFQVSLETGKLRES